MSKEDKPSCPNCGSHDLWRDSNWEGCKKCRYVNGSFTIVRVTRPKDLNEDEENDEQRNVYR
jgi:hypothetical protein